MRGETPTIHNLNKEGSFTFWARTTAESVTLPSHTSMLTGVVPIRHEVQWNKDLPLLHPVYPVFPTLFELAKPEGYTTAMAAGKSKFINLAKPGSLDWQFIPDKDKITDDEVAAEALKLLREHQPQVFSYTFQAWTMWATPAGGRRRSSLRRSPTPMRVWGKIIAAMQELHVWDSTLLIVTADHGGAGPSHGPEDPRSRAIPWIAVGPGVRKGLDLTTYGSLVVDTEDTFCTACYVLGLHPTRLPLDGKPVMEIFARTGEELMKGK